MAQLKDLVVNGNSRLIGDSMAQTPAAGTNNQEIATTAFVKKAVDDAISQNPATLSAAASVTTAPAVTVSKDTNMSTASSGTYYVNVTASESNGVAKADAGVSKSGFATNQTASKTCTVDPAVTNSAGKFYIPSTSITMADLGGGGDVGIDIYEVASGSQDANVTLSKVDIGSKDTTNYPYYFKVGAAGTTKSVTSGAVTATDGYIAASTPIASGAKSKSVTATERVEYVKLQAGAVTEAGGGLSQGTASGGDLSGGDLSGGGLSGGGLSAGSGEVSLTAGSGAASAGGNITLGTAQSTAPTTGYYISATGSGTVSAKGRGSVNRAAINRAAVSRAAVTRATFSRPVTRAAVTDTRTEGWIPTRSATTVIAAATETVTLAAGTLSAGSIAADSIAAGSGTSNWSDSSSLSSNSKTVYYPIATANCSHSGGGLSKGDPSGGGLTGGTLTAGNGSASVTTTPVVTPKISGTVISTGTTSYGITTTKPSGTDGTNFLTLDPDGTVTTTGVASGKGTVNRASVTRAAFSQTVSHATVTCTHSEGWQTAGSHTAEAADSTTVSLGADSTTIGATSATSNAATCSITPSVAAGTNYYMPIVSPAFTGGGTSVTIPPVVSPPTVEYHETGTFVSSTYTPTYGITTTKPSGTDGTNYLTVDATHTENNGSVSGSANITRNAVTYNGAAKGAISKASGTTALASSSSSGTGSITTTAIDPTVTDNFEPYYVPIVTASATAGTASASASIAKQPSASATGGTATASASQTGMTDGVSTTATSYYFTSSASATGGTANAASGYSTASASANGGSASVGKGITAGASASGQSSGNKSATSTEVTKSATGTSASDSSTIYLKAAGVSVSGGVVSAANGTASIAKQPSATTTASSATVTVTGMTTSSTATSYYVTASATSGSANAASGYSTATGGSASITDVKDTRTAGYLPARSATTIVSGSSKSGNTATSTEVTASSSAKTASSTIYIPAGACTVAGGGLSQGTASGGGLSGGDISGGGISGGDLSGGGLTAGAGSASASGNISLGSQTTTQPTSGYYISATGSGSVSRAAINRSTITRATITRASVTRATFSQAVTRADITDAHTAGYIPAKSATVVISSAASTVSLAAGTLAAGTSAAATSAATSIAADSKSSYSKTVYYPVTSAVLSNVRVTTAYDDAVPLVTTAGYIATNTIDILTVPASKKITVNVANSTSGSVVASAAIGSATTLTQANIITNGKWSTQTFTPSESVQGPYIGAISCAAITSTYVGSGVPRNSAGQGLVEDYYGSDGTNQRWCRIPYGYYPAGGSKANCTYLYLTDAQLKGWANTCGLGYDAGYAAAKVGTAGAAQVLSGYTFTNSSSVGASGTMTNNGAVSPSGLNCGSSYTIPAGYHNGSGKVTANSLSSQTGVDSGKTAVTAGAMLSGYQGWVNGSKISGTISNGTITNNTSGGSSSGTINRGNQIKIGAGYYSSDKYYTAQSNSGTKTISSSGTTSVDGYANASVAAGSLSAGSGSASLSSSNVTLSTTNNGISVTATGSGSVSVGTAGYLTSGTSQSSNPATATKYITRITVPSSGELTVAANGTAHIDAYRGSSVDLDINEMTGATIINSGTAHVTQNNYAGSTYVNARYSGTLTGEQLVANSSGWIQNTVTPSTSVQGPFYGRTVVNAAASEPSYYLCIDASDLDCEGYAGVTCSAVGWTTTQYVHYDDPCIVSGTAAPLSSIFNTLDMWWSTGIGPLTDYSVYSISWSASVDTSLHKVIITPHLEICE